MRLYQIIEALIVVVFVLLSVVRANDSDTTFYGDVLVMEPNLKDISQNVSTSTIVTTDMYFNLKSDERVTEGGYLIKMDGFLKEDLSKGLKYVVLVETATNSVVTPPSAEIRKCVNLFVVYQSDDTTRCPDLGVSIRMPCVVLSYKKGTELSSMMDSLYDQSLSWAELTDQYPSLSGSTPTTPVENSGKDVSISDSETSTTTYLSVAAQPTISAGSSTDSSRSSDSDFVVSPVDPSLARRLYIRLEVVDGGKVVTTALTSSQTWAIVGGTFAGVVFLLMIGSCWWLRHTIRRQREMDKRKANQLEMAQGQLHKGNSKPDSGSQNVPHGTFLSGGTLCDLETGISEKQTTSVAG
ncbi:hypothetical protein H4R33_006578 [Dimargaris cristalligena]|nr:hypothetical protein H4R33_006578 [Dimargaris cristalligena]